MYSVLLKNCGFRATFKYKNLEINNDVKYKKSEIKLKKLIKHDCLSYLRKSRPLTIYCHIFLLSFAF